MFGLRQKNNKVIYSRLFLCDVLIVKQFGGAISGEILKITTYFFLKILRIECASTEA